MTDTTKAMPKPRFALGATVYLNSGGPGMTVCSISRHNGKEKRPEGEESLFYYEVTWITEGTAKLRTASLPEEALHLIQRSATGVLSPPHQGVYVPPIASAGDAGKASPLDQITRPRWSYRSIDTPE